MLDGFGFRAFDSDPRCAYLPMRDVEVSISTPAELTQKVTVPDPPQPTGSADVTALARSITLYAALGLIGLQLAAGTVRKAPADDDARPLVA